jgi:RNA-directed DNA polymerase
MRRLKAFLLAWRGYFGFCETGSVFRDLDSWIRHRLRCVQWKQWKVYGRRKAELIRLGVAPELAHSTAWSAKGPWRMSHTPGVWIALTNGYYDALGLPRLEPRASI